MSKKHSSFLKNVDFYHDGQSELMLKCDKMFTWHMQRLLKKIEREAREIVRIENSTYSKPEKKLMSSIHSDGVSKIGSRNIRGSVSAGGSRAFYAKFVHEGTKPHPIDPKKPGGKLYFKWENRTGRVSETVRVRAKNRSKNSYRGGTNIYSLAEAAGVAQKSRNPSPGGSGGAIGVMMTERNKRGVGGMRPVFGRLNSRNGSNRIYLAGVNGRIGISDYNQGRGHRYSTGGDPVEREHLYRDEQRWVKNGKIKDKMVVVSHVDHPGYKGNPFLRKAMRKVGAEYGWDINFPEALFGKSS